MCGIPTRAFLLALLDALTADEVEAIHNRLAPIAA